jgi:hypothetical protein
MALLLISAIAMVPVNLAATVIVYSVASKRWDLMVLRHTFIARTGGLAASILVTFHGVTAPFAYSAEATLVHLAILLSVSLPAIYFLAVFVRLQTTEHDYEQAEETLHHNGHTE